MRGLGLLLLVGLNLATSATKKDDVPTPKGQNNGKPIKDIWHPLENAHGFPPVPTAGNVTEVPVVSGGQNETLHWNSTMKPDENPSGFQPPATDGKSSTATKKDDVPTPKENQEAALTDIWHPLENGEGFPPVPTTGTVTEGKQK